MDGWYQRFTNGSLYFNTRQWTAWGVIGKMEQKYESLNGSMGSWGFSQSKDWEENSQICQHFEGGVKCINTATIDDYRYRKILEKANNLNMNIQKNGAPIETCSTLIQKYRNFDTNEEAVIMFNPDDNEAYYMAGNILSKWKNLNGGLSCNNNSYPETTGYPKMDEAWGAKSPQKTEGKYQNFFHKQKGWSTIYDSKYGTWLVTDAIRGKHEREGGTASWLGFPKNDHVWAQSYCGKWGAHQEFEGGKIYAWDNGEYALKYDKLIEHYWETGEVEGVNAYGWPLAEEPTKINWNTKEMQFERGVMTQKIGLFGPKFEDGFKQCTENMRDKDRSTGINEYILNKIWEKEKAIYSQFERASGDLGIIHEYCSGYIVDYSNGKLKSNGSYSGYARIMYNPNTDKAYFMHGGIDTYYWNNGNCSMFGLAMNDEVDVGGLRFGLRKGFGFRQDFEKGVIYHYQKPKLIGSDIYTFSVKDPILPLYKQADYQSGRYGLPISESGTHYNHTCQNFVNGRICDNLSESEKRIIQKAESFGGGEIEGNFTKLCSHNALKFKSLGNLGTAVIFDINGSAYIIYGKVYEYWKSKGGCNQMGVPQNDTTKIAKYQTDGNWQYFKLNNGEYVDIYAPDNQYDTYHVTGGLQNAINSLGGTQKLGFIKNINGFSSKVCDETEFVAWDIENGRIYKVGNNYYHVKADSSVGQYFFNNGGHNKFGVPTSNEYGGGTSANIQEFSLATIKDPVGFWNDPSSDPELSYIFCPGEEPICGNNILEQTEVCDDGNTVNQDQCSSDCKNKCEGENIWDGNQCVPQTQPASCGNGIIEQGETCDDGNNENGDWCSSDCKIYDEKQKECMSKGMKKYINPNDENDIVCAKINPAPYINQYLNSNGERGNPKAGRTMCGANTVAMLAAAKGKYNYQGNYDKLKTYTYQDNEIQLTGMSRSCDWVNDIGGADMYNVTGVWSYVAYDNFCNQSIAWRMQKYLETLAFTLKQSGLGLMGKNDAEYWLIIKSMIDDGQYIIQQVTGPNFGHIFLVIGYTDDNRFIVNDPYTDLINHKGTYTFTGRGAIYSVEGLKTSNNIEIYYFSSFKFLSSSNE